MANFFLDNFVKGPSSSPEAKEAVPTVAKAVPAGTAGTSNFFLQNLPGGAPKDLGAGSTGESLWVDSAGGGDDYSKTWLSEAKEGLVYGAKEAVNPFSVDKSEREQALDSGSGVAGYAVGNILSSLGINAALTTVTGGVGGAVAGARAAKTASNVATALYGLYSGLGRDKIRTEDSGQIWKPTDMGKGTATALLTSALEMNPLFKVSDKLAAPLQVAARAGAQAVGEATLEKLHGGSNVDAGVAASLGLIGAGIPLYMGARAGEASKKAATEAADNMMTIMDATKTDSPEIYTKAMRYLDDLGTTRPPEASTDFKRYIVGDRGAELSPKTLEKAWEVRKGQFGDKKLDELYTIFQTENAITKAVGEALEEDLNMLSGGKIRDINPIARTAAPVMYAARAVDNVTGLDTSAMRDKITQAHHHHNNMAKYWTDRLKPMYKEAKDLGLSGEDVLHLVTKEDPTKYEAVAKKLGQNAEAFRSKLEGYTGDLLSYLEELGYSPTRRANYMPMKPQSRGKMVASLEQGVESLGSLLKAEKTNLQQVRAKLASAASTAGEIGRLRASSPLYEIVDTLDKVATQVGSAPIQNASDWSKLKDSLLQGKRLKSLGDAGLNIDDRATDLSALFARKGDVPNMIREKDAWKLLSGYINENLKAVHFDSALRYGNTYVAALEKLGMEKTAQLFQNYLSDQMGGARGLAGVMKNLTTKLEYVGAKRLQNAISPTDKALGHTIGNMAEFAGWLNNQIYPAKLALNVPGMIRNTTQFMATTVPELGHRYGLEKAFQASTSYLKKPHGWGEVLSELRAKNLISDFGRLETSDMAKAFGGAKGFIEGANEFLFKGYQATDIFNRFITWRMGKEVAADIMKGNKGAANFVGSMDAGAKQRVRALLTKEMDPKEKLDALHDIVGRYLISKTQFDYSAANKAEWARLVGPYFSMFTTWPAMVGSDIVTTLSEKGMRRGAEKLAAKFLPFYGVTLAASAALENSDSPGLQYLFANPTSYSPLDSVLPTGQANIGRGGILKNPTVETAGKVLSQAASLNPKGVARTMVTDVAPTYLPGIAPILNEIDRASKVFKGKKFTSELADDMGLKEERKKK